MSRRQDQQRLQQLQQTLAELQREEKEMAAERLGGQMARQQTEAPSSHHWQADGTPKHQQVQRRHWSQPTRGFCRRLLARVKSACVCAYVVRSAAHLSATMNMFKTFLRFENVYNKIDFSFFHEVLFFL